jgi:OPA family sugar phosphate sensor protein UhpC-like MFS transporter
MVRRIVRFFATRPDAPRLENPDKVKALYESKRRSVFVSLVLGYGFFYTTRLSLSVAKKDMVDTGVLEVDQMGVIGACLLYTYAFGKFTNGILSDRANIARFMSTALLLSAFANVLFGFASTFVVFAVLWALNGWFQSVGSAPSVVSLCQWFSHKERGTRYGIWAGAHNIGEGITFVGTSVLVSYWGWRWGFLGPGLICIVIALVLYGVLADRPQTYGLPPVAEYRGDESAGPPSKGPLKEMQMLVIKSPVIWILGFSSAFMYVTRYAIHSWGPLYLQSAKGYTAVEAGVLIGANTLLGLAGAACSGLLSDSFFESRRNVPTLLYGLLLTGSLVALYSIPSGHRNLDLVALACFEFAIGGLVVFLAGLTAVDLMPIRAAGAVKGTIGLMSYLGAATQDWVSGLLLKAGESQVAGETVINFDYAFAFWIGSSVLSMVLATLVWNVKPSD